MSFSDDVKRAQSRDKKCGLGEAIRSMTPEFAAEVCEALHDSKLHSTEITDQLKELGFRVNRFQVMNCRKKCECGAVPNVGS